MLKIVFIHVATRGTRGEEDGVTFSNAPVVASPLPDFYRIFTILTGFFMGFQQSPVNLCEIT